jgi:hypothetical protein
LRKEVLVAGLVVGTLIAVYGWFYAGCVVFQFMEQPTLPPSCIHSDDGEWTTIFGVVMVIVSAVELTRSFLGPKPAKNETR